MTMLVGSSSILACRVTSVYISVTHEPSLSGNGTSVAGSSYAPIRSPFNHRRPNGKTGTGCTTVPTAGGTLPVSTLRPTDGGGTAISSVPWWSS